MQGTIWFHALFCVSIPHFEELYASSFSNNAELIACACASFFYVRSLPTYHSPFQFEFGKANTSTGIFLSRMRIILIRIMWNCKNSLCFNRLCHKKSTLWCKNHIFLNEQVDWACQGLLIWCIFIEKNCFILWSFWGFTLYPPFH